MGRLFGTDGARGIANTEITCELAMKIGRAAAMVLTENVKGRPRVIVATDTRKSADMLSASISAGLCSVGANVLSLGVLPTPAVAYLVKLYNYDAAVMITASHNPCEYNGIKIFSCDGYKLPDSMEERIESIILDESAVPPIKIGGEVGSISRAENAMSDYIKHVSSAARSRFYGLRIALDCANGASSVTAQELFRELGAEVSVINSHPDGVNINRDCGSTHIERLSEFVRTGRYDAGFAFDGDADRVLAVDENGELVDGDKIIAVCALDMKNRNILNGNTVVVTVMSNMGLFEFLEKKGINYETTSVGDRYVLERMLERDYHLGGEQSGHVIFTDYATTGDGELTAVMLLNIMRSTGKSLSELTKDVEIFPQVLVNVKVSSYGKHRLSEDEDIAIAIEQSKSELGKNGRVLVRPSGTEPLVRVMLEGKDKEQIDRLANDIAGVIKERLI
ncbi:MAG: phosphoglucosamine mutase [Clostridia bacterium]|nr:phosphoglucosamine mutase [Clostridia bacterium]